MTGEQLKKYMEWSASYYNTYKDGDLTVSFNPEIRPYDYDMFSGINYEPEHADGGLNPIVSAKNDAGKLEDITQCIRQRVAPDSLSKALFSATV